MKQKHHSANYLQRAMLHATCYMLNKLCCRDIKIGFYQINKLGRAEKQNCYFWNPTKSLPVRVQEQINYDRVEDKLITYYLKLYLL